MLGSVASERELKPVYLLTGTDRPKIAIALQRLRGRIGEDATEQLHAGEASAEDAVAACNALGLFGGEARLVVVHGVETWKAADMKELEAYLAAPAPTTVLALVGDGIKRDAALAKAVAKAGQILAYDVSKKQLPEWAAEQFARLGAPADRDACRALVEAVGDDVGDTPEVHRTAPALRILVVEPDETTREALAVGLADDYLVTTTHEAAAALAILAEEPFDGIVIDASEATAAPDAVAAVERLVAAVLARAPGAAVIVTSTHDGVAPSARRLGVPYVAKPFSLRAVASSLAVALVRRP